MLRSIFILFLLLHGCDNSAEIRIHLKEKPVMSDTTSQLSVATFAAGCFWCVESVFQRLNGIEKVVSGYTGGTIKNPTYEQVCNGKTGHAEACQIFYDSSKITYQDLLEVFFSTHDPTTLNRQGNDVGTQYRSAIFYKTDLEKETALRVIASIENENIFDKPIITEISLLGEFYVAEDYHQNYYNSNKSQPYCVFVINPKLEKFKKKFRDRIKAE